MHRLSSLLVLIALPLVASFAALACAGPHHADGDDRPIALADVPLAARAAAERAVPGLKLAGAEVEQEDGRLLYCLHGSADGKDYEVEVTADGEVVEIETAGDHDHDDDHGDDEDDGEDED